MGGDDTNILTESILSYVRATQDLSVWTQDGRLIKSVKEQILNKLKEGLIAAVNREEVYSDILIIGSITGRQYLPTSDIDVTVVWKNDITENEKSEIVKYFKDNVNGFKIGSHPVNYYFTDQLSLGLVDGAYSLLTDQWIKPPADIEPFDPEERYEYQIKVAKMVADEVVKIIEELYRDLIDVFELKEIQNGFYNRLYIVKQFEVFSSVIALNGLFRQVVEERRGSFASGKSPQTSVGNIVYKFLERYGYLEKLKKINKIKKSFYEELTEAIKK